MRFVIIGGDAAGMSAASRAKRLDPSLEVTVWERTRDVSFSACGMPYSLGDPERSMDELIVRSPEEFRKSIDLDLQLGLEATGIDRRSKKVHGVNESGEQVQCSYDRLLIATGASAEVPSIPGSNQEGVVVLRHLVHGREIQNILASRPVRKVVILGMGYIALEMAEAFRARNIEVDMAKPRARFLPWMREELAQAVSDELEQNQVRLFPGFEVESIERSGERLRVNGKGLSLEGDLVLVGTGAVPNSRLAEECGLELGPEGSISVDRMLRTSDPEIYAAGDCADAYHVVSGEKTWIPLALRANRAGRAAGENVAGWEAKLDGVAGTAVFKVFSLQVARTGLNPEEASQAGFDPREVMIQASSRAHAHPGAQPIWVAMVGDAQSGRLLGTQIVGREGAAHRINAPAVALHAQMTVEAFEQTDLAYAPPFGPVWDPMLTAAKQLLKKL